ncbi:MAG: FecR family protein, partial [Burkholderiaceae bacterium]
MRHYFTIQFTRTLFLALLAMGISSQALAALAAKVEFAVGNVTATALDGQSRALAKGGDLNSGDSISTNNGQVQIRFTDGGFLSLKPNTVFKIEAYNFNSKADGKEKAFFSLVKGGLRTVTGVIGKANRKNYEMRTSNATIGIRGTAYSANQTDAGLNVFVSEGAVSVSNQGGSIVVEAGQSASVRSAQATPEMTLDRVPPPVPEAPQQLIEQQTTGSTVIFNEQVNEFGHSAVFDSSLSE